MLITQSLFDSPQGPRRLQARNVVGEDEVVLSLARIGDDDGAGESFALPMSALISFCKGFLSNTVGLASDDGALVDENGEGTDYALRDGKDSVWVRVDGAALWIRRVSWADVLVDAYRASADDSEGELYSMEVIV